jgi:cytidylate kinase
MLARDRFDSSRKHAPLRPAEDAVVLDTDGLNIQEVLDKILSVIEKSLPKDGSQ